MEFMFRIWDKRDNKWLEDTESIYINKNGQVCELQAASYGGETWLDEECIDHKVEVNFFTGLYDKKLNPIYEGDIISAVKFETDIPVGQLWEVYYDEERLTYYWRNKEGLSEPFWEFQLGSIQYIVIGNIYENPELIKN